MNENIQMNIPEALNHLRSNIQVWTQYNLVALNNKLETNKAATDTSITGLTTSQESIQNSVTSNTEKITALEEITNNFKDTAIPELEEDIETIEEKITDLEETNTQLSTDIGELQSDLESIDSNVSALASSVNAFDAEITSLKEEDIRLQNNIDAINTKVDDLETQIDDNINSAMAGIEEKVKHQSSSEDGTTFTGALEADEIKSNNIEADTIKAKTLDIERIETALNEFIATDDEDNIIVKWNSDGITSYDFIISNGTTIKSLRNCGLFFNPATTEEISIEI